MQECLPNHPRDRSAVLVQSARHVHRRCMHQRKLATNRIRSMELWLLQLAARHVCVCRHVHRWATATAAATMNISSAAAPIFACNIAELMGAGIVWVRPISCPMTRAGYIAMHMPGYSLSVPEGGHAIRLVGAHPGPCEGARQESPGPTCLDKFSTSRDACTCLSWTGT